MHDLQLQWLRLIRDATAAGLIRWHENKHDSETFDAESDVYCGYIQFRYPAYNDDAGGSDRDYVRVGDSRFTIGTPGWWLALETLASGLPQWQEHLRRVREGYEQDIRELSEAINNAS